jgi:hypothetical protein
MSAKNQLQEFFQKQQLPLPKYTIHRVGGPDHRPQYQSTLSYNDVVLTGAIFSNKGQATLDVAEQALKLLNTSEPLKIQSPDRTALFVDVENMPHFIDEVQKKIEGMTIYAFVGHHHHLSNKEWLSPIIKILVHSTRPDGTDTAMQVYVGYHLAHHNYDRYYIATRDHYGATLVEMISVQPGPWQSKTAYMVSQVDHIIVTLLA